MATKMDWQRARSSDIGREASRIEHDRIIANWRRSTNIQAQQAFGGQYNAYRDRELANGRDPLSKQQFLMLRREGKLKKA